MPLSNFIVLQRGFDLPYRKRLLGKYKVLSSGGASARHNSGPVKGPGFVVGRATNIGRPTWSDEDYWPLNTVLYARDFCGNDAKFAYYWFLSTDLTAYNSGSVQPMLNRNYIANVPIDVPPLIEQRGIAVTLDALDEKIKSNRHVVELVPRLIRALVSQALDDGTNNIAVTDLGTFINGGAYTKGASGTGRMVIRIAELNSGPGASTVYNDIEVPDERVARPGDLLMSWSGSLGVYRWVLDEAIVNQHIFKVLPSKGCPAWLVFDRLNEVMPVFRGIAKDKATTMGHIQRGHLASTVVEMPSAEGIADLDCQIGPLWERMLLAERETVKLIALRDALLPELMSGRIRVPEAAALPA